MKNKKAFSLTELLITIAIIGIMTGIAMTKLNGNYQGRREVQSAARKLEAIIRTAQNNSLTGKLMNGNPVCGYGVELSSEIVSGKKRVKAINYYIGKELAPAPAPAGTYRCKTTIDQIGIDYLDYAQVSFSGFSGTPPTSAFVFFDVPFANITKTTGWTIIPNFQLESSKDNNAVYTVCVNLSKIKTLPGKINLSDPNDPILTECKK